MEVRMPFESSPQEILARCRVCVPVNELVGNTVAAHRIAFAEFQQYGGQDARRRADYALRAVIVACAQSAEDRRSQLDYLSDAPMDAWELMDGFHAGWRDEAITGIARNMAFS